MKGLSGLVKVAAVVILAACGGDKDPIRVGETSGSIRGTVIDNTGATMANVPVGLTGNGQPARATNSGADGLFSFVNLPPGAYTLAATPPSGFTIGAAGTASVTVASGAQANAAAIVLNRFTLQQADSAFVAAVRAQLEAATAAGQFSGAVLVTRNGQMVFEGAYGLADRERGISNTTLTQFRAGSMYKMLTAVAALQLVQAGKMRLDVPLGTYLPDYPNADVASKVVPHNLLTHTGGTGDIFGPQFMANRSQLRNTSDYLALYGDRGLQFAPGAMHVYSNYGFILLGGLIERISRNNYDDYVAAHVLGPAGMTATGTAPEDSLVPGRSVGYIKQGNAFVSNSGTLPYRGTPAGGGYSTVHDFARFAYAVQQHRLLDQTHTELLVTGKVTAFPGTRYAYGFLDYVVGGRRFVGHSGGAPGMNGNLAFEPNGGYVVVVLSNLDPPAATQVSAFLLSILPATTP